MRSKSEWKKAVDKSADPVRALEVAKRLGPLLPTGFLDSLGSERASVLAAVLGGSKFLGDLLVTRPDWVEVLVPERLAHPRRIEGLRREVSAFFDGADCDRALARLREFRQREFLRIGARDLGGFGSVPSITEEISNVADVCLEMVCHVAFRQLATKYGQPYVRDAASGEWQRSSFCILGLGKLGGRELNYSSDVDVLFVYTDEGEVFKTPPGKTTRLGRNLPNHSFYARLAESIIAECTRLTGEGYLFRVDLRLRPEGKSAPLARSLAGYENYYAQWGQVWERMMLIKARWVAGDAHLGSEFLEMIQPFRYPRAISEQIPREVAAMKERIENEVVRAGELERNVKLGRGGIREIEFVAQTLQVLHAGRQPFLQGAQTLPTLDQLRDYHLISSLDAERMKTAYCFLRNVEHRLQMEDNRQTHTIPSGREARSRLARLMGFPTLPEFEQALQRHHDAVRAVYDRVVRSNGSESHRLPPDVAENSGPWRDILARHSFRDPDQALKLAREFVEGPGVGHRSSRTTENALQLFDRLLAMCPRLGRDHPPEPYLSDPDRVLTRLDTFVAKYGARSMLYEAWATNPSLFSLLLVAFDRSEFLAELAIRVPDLIDEIEQSGQLRRRKGKERILEDLRAGAQDPDQSVWLRRYFQAEQMRVGLRDILGLGDAAQTQAELTALADAYLSYALEVVMRRHRLRRAPFAIFGLGKLGGGELIYASDLDVVFISEDRVSNLSKLQKIAVELIELISERTELGTTFAVDTRLRPDGEKGLLVKTVSACAEYYRKRALLWEIQSLSRARPIAGNAAAVQRFSQTIDQATDFSRTSPFAAALTPDWKNEIHRMRLRIEKERTPVLKEGLAIKTGAGGLMDVEFIAQAVCLEHGWREPNTLAAIERAGRDGIMADSSAQTLATNYRRLMEIERILRRWSFEAESILPEDPAAFYRVSVRCGFRTPDDFQNAVNEDRRAIRAIYQECFEV